MSQLLAKFEDVTEWPYSQLASQGLPEKSFVDKENIQLKQNSLNPREDAWSQGSLELSPVLAMTEVVPLLGRN